MDRFDTGAASYRKDYSLPKAPAGTFFNSSLGDYLTKKEIGQGTVKADPVAPERAPSAPEKSFFFFDGLFFSRLEVKGRKQPRKQQARMDKWEKEKPTLR
ncbi:MAG: hypothetical protein K2W97_03040 [Chthoniobacterales bacterium]|nr:hypothetical protein [Chthoniobacterales bacterium]